MKVELSLFGVGWMAATLSDETASARVTASDLGDALGDLLLAVWTLLDGDAQARCSWWEEPGECRWLFARDAEQATLRVLEFDELYGNAPDDVGRLIFETAQPMRSMGAAFAEAASQLFDEYGIEGYRAKWMDGDFPADTLASIRLALAGQSR
jgi:hypothetical protein